MPGRLMADKDTPSGRPPSTTSLPPQRPNGVLKPAQPSSLSASKPQQEHPIKREPPNGVATTKAAQRPPPELLEITTFSYPLRHLLDRNAQDCFAGLLELLDSMQDIPPHVNGVSANQPLPDLGEFDAARRRNWMQFAKYYRDRFVKILVLIRWLEGAQDFKQLYAIDEYLLRLLDASDNTIWSFQDMRDAIAKIKVPSPDIETAVSVLARGQVSSVPHLTYVPPPPLTDEKLLQTLRQMNMILHVRLNRDENLPSYLRNFTIHSGRATFTIPHEFELDLSIGSEDSATQLFFLDLRFLFTPNIEIPHFFLTQLDMKVNVKLAEEGVRGAFEMLHEFVLTHKINLLRRQAIDLNQRSWAGTLRVEQIHRTLVVQYWQDRPGKKSWLEIGATVGGPASHDGHWKEPQPPQLGVRWYRNGVLVPDARIDLPLGNLKMAAILKSAIAQHTSWMLSAISISGNGLVQMPATSKDGSELEMPADPSLLNERITLTVEPRSGRFSLQPWTYSAIYYETQLNRLEKPDVEAIGHLRSFQCSLTQDRVTQWCLQGGLVQERNIEWAPPGPRERISFFQVPQWSGGWRLLWTLSQGSQSWVALQTDFNPKTMKRRPIYRIPIHMGRISDAVSCAKFIEYALMKISAITLHEAVLLRGLEAQMCSDKTMNHYMVLDVSSIIPGLRVRVDLRIGNMGDACRLRHGPRPVTHIIRGKLAISGALKRMLRETSDSGIDVAENGHFHLVLVDELGSPSILEDVLTQLRGVARLDALLRSLQAKAIEPNFAGLRAVEFSYVSAEPDLRARVTFSLEDGSIAVSFLPKTNPHRRIAQALKHTINKAFNLTKNESGIFSHIIDDLRLCLPALRVLDKLERKNQGGEGIHITANNPCTFRCSWRSGYMIELSLRKHLGARVSWTIGKITAPGRPGRPLPEAMRQANMELGKILNHVASDGKWRGVRYAIIATLDGTEEPLERIDSVLRPLGGTDRVAAASRSGPGGSKSEMANEKAKPTAAAAPSGGKVSNQPAPKGQETSNNGATNASTSKRENQDVVVLD